MQVKFGDGIKIKDLIKYIKLHSLRTSTAISKNFTSKEMAKRLYASEDIFITENNQWIK